MKDKQYKEGFDLPNDYFKEFENRLFDRINIEYLPKDSGFSTPKKYFDELDNRISHRVNQTNNTTKVISIVSRKTILYAASIAAIAILIFSITNNKNEVLIFDDIEFSSIKTYRGRKY